MKTKSIFTPYVARRLLKMGNPIIDIKPCKEERSKTIFVFEVTDKFQNDLPVAIKHDKQQKGQELWENSKIYQDRNSAD